MRCGIKLKAAFRANGLWFVRPEQLWPNVIAVSALRADNPVHSCNFYFLHYSEYLLLAVGFYLFEDIGRDVLLKLHLIVDFPLDIYPWLP